MAMSIIAIDRIKKYLLALSGAFLLAFALGITAFAEEPTFVFDLTIDGVSETRAAKGEVVTVALRLKRTDGGGDFTMYAMQDEVAYDPAFFRLVPEGTLTRDGIRTADVTAADGRHSFVLSFVSFEGGESWSADTLVGMFQLEIIGDSGAATLENTRYLVSQADGAGLYEALAQDVTVVVSDECTVVFAVDGAVVATKTVPRGGKLTLPDVEERAGYRLNGWYRDAALTELWDMQRDTVTVNTTLYAAYEPVSDRQSAADVPLWPLGLVLPMGVAALLWRRGRRK